MRWTQDSKGGGEGFEVQKYGDGRVALIGARPKPTVHEVTGLLYAFQDRQTSQTQPGAAALFVCFCVSAMSVIFTALLLHARTAAAC